MALNIKDEETEALVTKIVSLTGETEAEAVREAARERLGRLEHRTDSSTKNPMAGGQLRRWLEAEVWPNIPAHLRGKGISKAEREEILGYGPDGV